MIRQPWRRQRFWKCDNDYLKQVLAENSTQTQKEFAKQLGVTQQIIAERPQDGKDP